MVDIDRKTKALLFVALSCLCIIYYYGSATNVAIEGTADLRTYTRDSVIKSAENRSYVNLVLFMQAGVGLVFIFAPVVIVVYKNRSVLKRLNQRKLSFYGHSDSQLAAKVSIKQSVVTDPERKFSAHLLRTHPNLTPYDLKLCSLLRLNLTSKEIAEALNITPGSVNTARYRLRKKLTLPKEADLIIYLNNLAQNT